MPPKILVVDDNRELLSLLTRLFEQAGYSVLAAAKGKQALDAAQTSPPAIAVLDILLPDMMGYQVADGLRKQQPKIPLIFITGVFKAGRHALEARSKYQAAGYFEKPFEGQKLLEVVGKIVPAEKPTAEVAPAEDPFDVEVDVHVQEDDPSQNAMELTGIIKVTGGGNLVAEIRGANLTASQVPSAKPQPASAPATRPIAATAATAALSNERIRGELRDNLPSLITAFHLARETGELGVQRGKVKKIVYFQNGQPVFAMSNLLSERFGQFLTRVGKIKPDQLDDALAAGKATKRRIGEVLLERGLLKDTERMYFVGQQVKSIIYSLFGWEDGNYVLTFKDKATAEPIKLDVHPAMLIVRGIKKLYKPERLKRLLSHDDLLIPSLQPDYQLHEVQLEKWEAELLAKVDGNRSVTELIEAAQRPEAIVHAFLYSLVALSILELRT